MSDVAVGSETNPADRLTREDVERMLSHLDGDSTQLNLKGFNLVSADLSELKLRGANLEGAYLEDAILLRVNLDDARLTDAQLFHAILVGASLIGANLAGAYLSNAIVADANLTRANLERAKLGGAYLRGTILSEANLQNAQLGSAYLGRAVLERANLSGADMSFAHLREARLAGAYLRDARLTGAILEGVNLVRANLTRANLTRANLTRADLLGAHLQEAILQGANLEGALLTSSHLEGAHLGGANLSGAVLIKAHLENADLAGASLAGADLDGANLAGANLEGTNLLGATLKGVSLGQARISAAGMLLARSAGADIDGVIVTSPRTHRRHADDWIHLGSNIIDGCLDPGWWPDCEVLKDVGILRSLGYSPSPFLLMGMPLDFGLAAERFGMGPDTLFIAHLDEEPLRASSIATLYGAMTELYTRSWLIFQRRFEDLQRHVLTGDAELVREAGLAVGRVSHNSPWNGEFADNSDATPPNLRAALGDGLRSLTQTEIQVRQQEAESALADLRVEREKLDQQHLRLRADHEIEVAKQTATLDRQERELVLREMELDLREKELELREREAEVAYREAELKTALLSLRLSLFEHTHEVARKIVAYRSDLSEGERAMAIQALIPSLQQLSELETLSIVPGPSNTEQASEPPAQAAGSDIEPGEEQPA